MDIIGVIINIVGIILAFVFFKIGDRKKKLNYIMKSQPLITKNISEIDGLTISLYGEPIDNLMTTTVRIQSTGKEIIEMKDFAMSEPLCVNTDGKFFMSADQSKLLTYNSNESNRVTFTVNDSSIQIFFDYFSHNDEIDLTFFHTGKLSVSGKLKNGKLCLVDSLKKKLSISNLCSLIVFILTLLYAVIVTFYKMGSAFIASEFIRLILYLCIGLTLIDYYFSRKE